MTGFERGSADPEIWDYTTELVEELACQGVEADFDEVLAAVASEWPYGEDNQFLCGAREMAVAVKEMMEDM
ncbi:hypothetical protein [Corynebacterium sp.]|uniref:hypothetical protein n=1 Tax=Corynebacterium sp. TaxID=1720 RepID=UPI0028AD0A7B|nr:hypothetical protein [Corynebacterium sp.]